MTTMSHSLALELHAGARLLQPGHIVTLTLAPSCYLSQVCRGANILPSLKHASALSYSFLYLTRVWPENLDLKDGSIWGIKGQLY